MVTACQNNMASSSLPGEKQIQFVRPKNLLCSTQNIFFADINNVDICYFKGPHPHITSAGYNSQNVHKWIIILHTEKLIFDRQCMTLYVEVICS